jgi:transcriptional regulator of acetoin/glycerol metabolism
LRLQQTEVIERRKRFLDLIGGFGPELDKASIIPDTGRYCLLITDKSGIVVEAYTPDAYASDFSRFGIAIGGVWNERIAGTNGIAMALQTDRVLTVQGSDHYFRCFNEFACTSAPLHDALNHLIGSMTIVGPAKRQPEKIAWIEQVLRVTKSRFQAQLFRKFHADRITARLVSYSPDTLRRFGTMVACDESGTIVSSVPLGGEGLAADAQQQLEGRHLSDLRDMTVTIRGPLMILPRRMVSVSNRVQATAPMRLRPDTAIASLAVQGGGLDLIVERARKLVANRVPLLICGEHGVEKDAFARALLQDALPGHVLTNVVDAGRGIPLQDFAEMLHQVRFLSEYPTAKLPPVLVLLNADRLGPDLQGLLKNFLESLESGTEGAHQIAVRPLMIFSVGRDWRDLSDANDLDPALIYLMGQAIVNLPSLRDRVLDKVLDGVLTHEFDNRIDLSDAARQTLLAYDWPGNLRELRAVLREAAICGNGRRINHVDLPHRLHEQGSQPPSEDRRQALVEALDSTGWNVTKAAGLLGKSRATVNRWISQEGLERPAAG